MRRLLFICICFWSIISVLQAQDYLFKGLSDRKDVTSIYVSKALLSKLPDIGIDGVDFKKLKNKLDKLEVYISHNKNAAQAMKTAVESLQKKNEYDLLMKIKDKEQFIHFCTKPGKGDKFEDFIMAVSTKEECTIIRVTGSFTMKDLQELMDGIKVKDNQQKITLNMMKYYISPASFSIS